MSEESIKSNSESTLVIKQPPGTGGSYPVETILASLDTVSKLVAHRGSGSYIDRKDAIVIIGKSPAVVNGKLSTAVQYGILSNKHGKGYITTDKFQQYTHPVYGDDQKKALLNIFSTPELYSKIIADHNSKTLPNESGFTNLLIKDYNIHKNSAERASKVFFENARKLDVLDSNNRLRFIMPAEKNGSVNNGGSAFQEKADLSDEKNKPLHEDGSFDEKPNLSGFIDIPVPLNGGRRAYIKIPEDYTPQDCERIAKFVEALK